MRRHELDGEFRASGGDDVTAHEVWVRMARDLVWWTPGEHSTILEDALQADPEDSWSRLALAESYHR
ncbi:MAG: hypothetical protein WKF75_17785 [Singulisphaera sp.]